jgi:hypothetical protein
LTSDGTLAFEYRDTYADSLLSETSINAVQNKVVTAALNDKADKTYVDKAVANAGSSITVDSELSETSENPVQNKVVSGGLADLALAIDDLGVAFNNRFEIYENTISQKADTTYVDTAVSNKLQKEESDGKVFAIADGILSNTTDNHYFLPDSNEDANYTLATKGEVDKLTQDILDNEKATAEAFVYLDEEQKKIAANIAAFEGQYAKVDFVESSIEQMSSSFEQIISDNEEVAAIALTNLDNRIVEIFDMVENDYVKRNAFDSTVTEINNAIDTKADNSKVLESLSTLNEHVDTLYASVDDRATKNELQETVDVFNAIISENEEIVAYALNDLNEKCKLLEQDTIAIESNSKELALVISELCERISALETIINS